MTDFTSFQTMRQQRRRFSQLNSKAKRRYEALVQKSGQDVNATPERVEAEMERRLLIGNKDMRDLNWRGIDTRKVKANTDGIIASGVTMDARTTIGRAVGITMDDADIKGTRFVGPINGGSARRARMRYVRASNIDRNNFDESGSIQTSNDFSFSSAVGVKSVNVNAALVSHVGSNMDGAKIIGGWHTQCYFDRISLNDATVTAGLDRSSLNDMFGRNVNFQPKLTVSDDYSMHGSKLVDSKVSYHVAAKAQNDNAALENCKVIGELEAPKPKALSPHERFARLSREHDQLHIEHDNDLALPRHALRPNQGARISAAVLGLAA